MDAVVATARKAVQPGATPTAVRITASLRNGLALLCGVQGHMVVTQRGSTMQPQSQGGNQFDKLYDDDWGASRLACRVLALAGAGMWSEPELCRCVEVE